MGEGNTKMILGVASEKNTFARGWSWWKQGYGLFKSEKSLRNLTLLFCVLFLSVMILFSFLKIGIANLTIYVVAAPFIAYLYCRFYETLTLKQTQERPLVKHLLANLGPFVLMGIIFALGEAARIYSANALTKSLPSVQLISTVVGTLIQLVFFEILHQSTWLMAVRKKSLPDALSLAIVTFFKNIKSIFVASLPASMIIIPPMILLIFAIWFQLNGLKTAGVATTITLMGFSVLTFAAALVATLTISVFVNAVKNQDLLDEA